MGCVDVPLTEGYLAQRLTFPPGHYTGHFSGSQTIFPTERGAMTKRERMILAVAALGGDECWVRNEDAASAAHMDGGEAEAILRALAEAGQFEAGAGMVKLSTWRPATGRLS